MTQLNSEFGNKPSIIKHELEKHGILKSYSAVKKKLQYDRKRTQICTETYTEPVKEIKKIEKPFKFGLFNITPNITKVFAFYDSHYPHHIDTKPVLDFLADFKPDEIIFGGDNWSLDVISHWNEIDIRNTGFHGVRSALFKEAEGFSEEIDRFRNVRGLKRFTYILGNHEAWLSQFESKHPSFSNKEGLTIERLLRLENRGISVIPFCGSYRVGKLCFVHGHEFGTENPPKQALMRTKSNLVFGHHHSYKVWSWFSMSDELDKNIAVQVPCYCKMAPKYMKGSPNNWQNGFFTAIVKNKTGNFTQHVTLASNKGNFFDQFGKEYANH